MEDSTPTQIVTRQARQGVALDKAIPSIMKCGVFSCALDEYLEATEVAHSADDDLGVLYPMASLIDQAARNMVAAAADYHCTRVLFAAQKAIIALEE